MTYCPWESRTLVLLLVAFSAALGAGCSGAGGDDDSTSPTGTPSVTPATAGEDFVSALSGGGYYGEDAAAAPGDDAAQEGDASGDAREVEEADIFLQEGDTLYILNMYRGLMILDVSDPDDPLVLGRLPLTGYPVEMYVRDGRAYVVVSDYFTYWRVDEADTSTSSFYGSMIAIVDVADGTAPMLLGQIDLEGFVSQTRAVGDVIYAVSTRYSYYSCGSVSDDDEDSTTVISIDIGDPTDPHEVDSVSWPGSWAQVHATSNTLYVVEPDYNYEDTIDEEPDELPPEERPDGDDDPDGAATPTGEGTAGDSHSDPEQAGGPAGTDPGDQATPTPYGDPGNEPDETITPTPARDPGQDEEPTEPPAEPAQSYYVSHITYLDISDPHGTIVERGRIDVPGQTWDKFALDEFEDTFRIVTQKWDGVTSGTLSVIDVSDPGALSVMAEMDIVLDVLESVTATRFDGTRGYVVTAEQTDPLFIIDLSDPSNPRLAGEVHMSGRLDHLEPLGERIVALGQDTGDEGTWRFAVSLFDVSDMDDPSLLDREHIGDDADTSWSQATWDDKAFTLLPDDDDPDDRGLIAVPFYAYTYAEEGYYSAPTGGVQLLDFNQDDLNKRGMVTHPGYVTRVRPVNNRLASMSNTRLLMIDIDDLDNPRVTRDLQLARNITDYVPMGDRGVQLALPNWYDGQEEANLRVVPGDSPDLVSEALSEVALDLDSGQLVPLSDALVAVAYTRYDESWEATSWLDVYDITDPGNPVRVSSTELPAPVWVSYYYGWYAYSYGSSGGVLVQSGSLLAYLETTYDYYYYGYPVDTVEETEPGEGGASAGETSEETGDSESSGTTGETGEATPAPTPRDGTPSPYPGDDEPGEEAAAPLTTLHIIDLADPVHPSIVSIPFDQSLFGLWADGTRLYATHAEPIEGESLARYYVDVVDVSDSSAPEVLDPVNIPGTALYTPDGGATLVTLDSQWATSTEGYDYLEYRLYTVALRGGGASGLDRIELPGYVQSLAFSGDAAYALTQDYYWDVDWESYCGYYGYPLHLRVIDLRDPKALVEAGDQRLPLSYGYLRDIEQGRLFVDGYAQGMLIYDITSDPFVPAFETSIRTSGWVMQVRAQAHRAFLPAGLYGVFSVDLATP